MKSYETSATVGDEGQVRVVGVPFEPGTHVEVTIKPIESVAGEPALAQRDRAARLLVALDAARNAEAVGPLRREDLYDRGILH